MPDLTFQLERQVVRKGYDRKTEWFQPRVSVMPPRTVILTVTTSHLWGSDIFGAAYVLRSDDFGRTWTEPMKQASLDRRILPSGIHECPCDLTPMWHRATGTLLATGHTAIYAGAAETKGELLKGNVERRHGVYAVFDPQAGCFQPWQKLVLPDAERFWWFGAGCTQRVDRPDGDILLPLYFMDREQLGDNLWKGCFSAAVARCAFDGRELRYLEHGTELTVTDRRGFCEPSLTFFQGRYYLTLRNDVRAYVAVSDDGLHFPTPKPWTFDDGTELGSFNTQQHWVTHSEGLYLSYTRRGANNEDVMRCRAPLFLARVDPARLVVLRDTEIELVPNHGAQLGNFGTANASPDESWVVTSEGMRGGAAAKTGLEFAEERGADNRIWLCRLRWNQPNKLVTA